MARTLLIRTINDALTQNSKTEALRILENYKYDEKDGRILNDLRFNLITPL